MGTIQIDGATPKLTIGNATAEDATILFDGNAQDFYIALDDSADDLLIGLGSTVGTTPAISIDENLAVKTYGDITMTGATPTLTIGDAGAEDAKIVFDGNAQDFHIGLDDSADDLVIGVGSALGTTPAIQIADNLSVTVGKSLIVSKVANIPFYNDNAGSIYTHDVSGTDDNANNNTAYGINALDAITTGDSNVAIGHQAATALTTAYNSVFVGKDAGLAVLGGAQNTFIGFEAGGSTTTGSRNTAVGNLALDDGFTTEGDNTAVGHQAMGGSAVGNGAEFNTVVGSLALDALTTGDSNSIIGYTAGTAMTTGKNNTCIGSTAGGAIVSGQDNTIVGYLAGDALTTGSSNVIIGSGCDQAAVDADSCIVIGKDITAASNDFTFGRASNTVSNDFDTDNAWTQSSDVRKKKNIKDAVLGLDFVNDLRPVTYQWKPSYDFPKDFVEYNEENQMRLDKTMHGLVAQEVKAALDKTGVERFGGWKEDKDGCQRISKEMFVFPLIKAVQELTARVKELEAK